MLTVLRDDSGNIQAACEWWTVNSHGTWDLKGQYVWVNQLEHSPNTNGVELIRDVIAQIAWLAPQAVGAYWERRDKGNKLFAFKRETLLKYKQKEEVTA